MKDLNITFDYNEEADLLHISFGTDEPSYCEEVDDIMLVERGYFSNSVTGFQVMDVKHHGIKEVQVVAYVERVIEKERKQFENRLKQRARIPSIISKGLAKQNRIQHILQDA